MPKRKIRLSTAKTVKKRYKQMSNEQIIKHIKSVRNKRTSFKILLNMGLNARRIKARGFTVKTICKIYSWPYGLMKLGFSAKELKAHGFSFPKLLGGNFPAKELKALGFVGKKIRTSMWSLADLPLLKQCGYTAGELKKASFNANYLMDAGFNLKQLKTAGFTVKEILQDTLGPLSLRRRVITENNLLKVGFTKKEIAAAHT